MIYRVCEKLPNQDFNPYFILNEQGEKFSDNGHFAFYLIEQLLEDFFYCEKTKIVWYKNTIKYKVLFEGTKEQIKQHFIEYMI